MQLQDTFKITGDLLIKTFDERGILVNEVAHKNLVVTTGKQLIASRIYSDTRNGINITGSSGTGSFATLTFAAQPVAPYEIGTYITVTGNGVAANNGDKLVTACTTTSVTFEGTGTTSSATGVISSLYNGTINTMKIGESETASNLSDVDLYSTAQSATLTAAGNSRSLVVSDQNAYLVYIATFPAEGGAGVDRSIREAGLFNASNKMMCRSTFPLTTKLKTQTLQIFWTVTIN